MRIAASGTAALPAEALERDALETAMEALAEVFGEPCGDRGALFVASSDAGTRTTLRFWSDARRVGLSLASPELFPWCLSNAACGALARRFGVTGPNATWLGGPEALDAAWTAAERFLAGDVGRRAYVVSLEFGSCSSVAGQLRAWRLDVDGTLRELAEEHDRGEVSGAASRDRRAVS